MNFIKRFAKGVLIGIGVGLLGAALIGSVGWVFSQVHDILRHFTNNFVVEFVIFQVAFIGLFVGFMNAFRKF
jgi:hypothetical protein